MSHQKITNNWRKFLKEGKDNILLEYDSYDSQEPTEEEEEEEEGADSDDTTVQAGSPGQSNTDKLPGDENLPAVNVDALEYSDPVTSANLKKAVFDLLTDLTELVIEIFEPTSQISSVDFQTGTVRYTYEDFIDDKNAALQHTYDAAEHTKKGEFIKAQISLQKANFNAALMTLSLLGMIPAIGKIPKYTNKSIKYIRKTEKQLRKADKVLTAAKKSVDETNKVNSRLNPIKVKAKAQTPKYSSKPPDDDDIFLGGGLFDDMSDAEVDDFITDLYSDLTKKQAEVDRSLTQVTIKAKDVESRQVGVTVRKSSSIVANKTLQALKSGEVVAHSGPGIPSILDNMIIIFIEKTKHLSPSKSTGPLEVRVTFKVKESLQLTDKKVNLGEAAYYDQSELIRVIIDIHPRFVDESGRISKYAYQDIADVLKNTALHEITHARQHARFKILPGESYKDAITRDFAAAQVVPLKSFGSEMTEEELLKYFKEVDKKRGADDFARIYYSSTGENNWLAKTEVYLKYRTLNPSEIEAMTRDSITSLSVAKKTGKDTLDNMARSIGGIPDLDAVLSNMAYNNSLKETKLRTSYGKELRALAEEGVALDKERDSLPLKSLQDMASEEYQELTRKIELNIAAKHRVAEKIGKINTFQNSHLILKKQIEHAKIKYPCAPISLYSLAKLFNTGPGRLPVLKDTFPLGNKLAADAITELFDALDYTGPDLQNFLEGIKTQIGRFPTDLELKKIFIPMSKKCPKQYVSKDHKRFGAGAIPQKFKDRKGKKTNKENVINDMVNIITEILSID